SRGPGCGRGTSCSSSGRPGRTRRTAFIAQVSEPGCRVSTSCERSAGLRARRVSTCRHQRAVPGGRRSGEETSCVQIRRGCNSNSAMTPVSTIREILTHKGGTVWTIAPEATVFEAIQMMAEKNIGVVLVTKDNKLAGIVTERDY